MLVASIKKCRFLRLQKWSEISHALMRNFFDFSRFHAVIEVLFDSNNRKITMKIS